MDVSTGSDGGTSPKHSSRPPAPKTKTRAKTIGLDFAAPKEKKPKGVRSTERPKRQKNAREAEDRRERNEWVGARPGHFVALYGACHEKVYGFIPNELENGREYALATLAASRMLRTIFDGKGELMVDFIKWSWRREESREKWRRENNMGGQRLGWRLQFNGSLISDYRLDITRRKGA